MTQRWNVIIPHSVISWIQKQNPSTFDDYVKAVDGVRDIANIFSHNTIAACGEGFLIEVPNQKIALRCAFFIEKKQIHITGFKPLIFTT